MDIQQYTKTGKSTTLTLLYRWAVRTEIDTHVSSTIVFVIYLHGRYKHVGIRVVDGYNYTEETNIPDP